MYEKILIKCELVVCTGLHIGSANGFSAIGAESPVIRDALTGRPIIPGSSLKGKLRSLLARSISGDIEKMPAWDGDDEKIKRLFGSAKPVSAARLQFSDCFIINSEELSSVGLTEVKFENSIDRGTAVANPRSIERVNPGVRFGVNIVYEAREPDKIVADMKLLAKGIKLLQLDYLGGHGSRGSGRVSFRNFSFSGIDSDVDKLSLKPVFEEVEQYELFPV